MGLKKTYIIRHGGKFYGEAFCKGNRGIHGRFPGSDDLGCYQVSESNSGWGSFALSVKSWAWAYLLPGVDFSDGYRLSD